MIRPHLPRSALRSLALVAILFGSAAAAVAAEPTGRWQGVADIPAAPMPLLVDIAPDGAHRWVGSVTLPGRGVKGVPIEALQVSEGSVRLNLAAAFPGPRGPVVQADLRWLADGSLGGEFRQGGHIAPVLLRRTGVPQVDLPEPATAVSAALAGTWVGRYELDDYPRDVTVKLAVGMTGVAAGELLVVGRRTTTLTIDRVVQGSQFIVLKATAADFRIEGRWSAAEGTIRGEMLQGPFEAPLVLRRTGAGAPGKP